MLFFFEVSERVVWFELIRVYFVVVVVGDRNYMEFVIVYGEFMDVVDVNGYL